jgi:hypothetical protein
MVPEDCLTLALITELIAANKAQPIHALAHFKGWAARREGP